MNILSSLHAKVKEKVESPINERRITGSFGSPGLQKKDNHDMEN
jgi:hypothetical protein